MHRVHQFPIRSLVCHVRRNVCTSTQQIKKTALHPLHIELKGKMVEFCGWELPLQYGNEGIVSSHLHTRSKGSLFDVSHMAQLRLVGKDRIKFLESLVVADLKALPENHAVLSLFTNEAGGIIDDTIITNRGSHIHLVVNAGCADKDIAHLSNQVRKQQSQGLDVQLERLDRSLLALQGPLSESILAKLVPNEDLSRMPFMSCREMNLVGNELCLVSRCGYTGEDGFEISVDHGNAIKLAKRLLSFEEIKPSGLGARDSLRLEAGLCLYGHDIDEHITPVEASLQWTIGKRRKQEGGFLGAEKILKQLNEGPSKKRVGLIVNGPPAREGATIHDKTNNNEIGVITSGSFSPILKQSIAMGYIQTPFSKLNTELQVKIRDKIHPGTVVKMPFVPSCYKKI